MQLIEGLQLTLERWSKQLASSGQVERYPDEHSVLIRDPQLPTKLVADGTDRHDMKVSVKVFTYSESCSVFTAAVNLVMTQLGVEWIDSLTLALPPSSTQGSIEFMKPIWSCAVMNVRVGRIKELGVSDLNTEQLKELYAWAEEIKPTTNQINLESCCVIPPEMNQFAQSNEIRLLTHNDPRGDSTVCMA